MRMARLGLGALALSLATAAWPAWSQTKIDFFFPVPVEGKLAREMTRLVKLYNESQKEVEVVASYTAATTTPSSRLRLPPRPASRPRSC